MVEMNWKQTRKDLKPFDIIRLNELRHLMREKHNYCEGPNKSFWDELECILRCNPKSYEWERMPKDEVVFGDVWSQPIGEFYHEHTVHRFTYLYVDSQGLVIGIHGHEEPFHNGKQILRASEWYIFPDGTMELCKRGCTHQLVNNYGHPIYVISLKNSSNAR